MTRVSPGWMCPLIAVVLACLGVAWVGPGTFGPDASGAQAAAVLGGHPYPLHPLLVRVTGSGRLLSVLSAGALAFCGVRLAPHLGASPWATGLALGAAPLQLYAAALGGGDAPAMALALGGIALAWSGRFFPGALLATCSLAIKPIALPLLGLLLVTPLVATHKRRDTLLTAIGTLLGLFVCRSLLEPLWSPRLASGILGSWWLSSGGGFASPSELPQLALYGIRHLWDLPAWTGHPILGALALAGAVLPGEHRSRRIAVLVVGLGGLWAVASGLGEQLRPRYLAPAAVPLVLLAAIPLGRAPWMALLGAWPGLALLSHIGALRAQEEDLSSPTTLPFPGLSDVSAQYRDSSICGAGELRALAAHLAGEMPRGAEVVAVRLRDGREGDLLWPLAAARPDLKVTVLSADCCEGGLSSCVERVWAHLENGGALVSPLHPERCTTEVVDPREMPLVSALGTQLSSAGIYAVLELPGPGNQGDACEAARPRPAGEPPR